MQGWLNVLIFSLAVQTMSWMFWTAAARDVAGRPYRATPAPRPAEERRRQSSRGAEQSSRGAEEKRRQVDRKGSQLSGLSQNILPDASSVGRANFSTAQKGEATKSTKSSQTWNFSSLNALAIWKERKASWLKTDLMMVVTILGIRGECERVIERSKEATNCDQTGRNLFRDVQTLITPLNPL